MCSRCTERRVAIPGMGYHSKVRVCDGCVRKYGSLIGVRSNGDNPAASSPPKAASKSSRFEAFVASSPQLGFAIVGYLCAYEVERLETASSFLLAFLRSPDADEGIWRPMCLSMGFSVPDYVLQHRNRGDAAPSRSYNSYARALAAAGASKGRRAPSTPTSPRAKSNISALYNQLHLEQVWRMHYLCEGGAGDVRGATRLLAHPCIRVRLHAASGATKLLRLNSVNQADFASLGGVAALTSCVRESCVKISVAAAAPATIDSLDFLGALQLLEHSSSALLNCTTNAAAMLPACKTVASLAVEASGAVRPLVGAAGFAAVAGISEEDLTAEAQRAMRASCQRARRTLMGVLWNITNMCEAASRAVLGHSAAAHFLEDTLDAIRAKDDGKLMRYALGVASNLLKVGERVVGNDLRRGIAKSALVAVEHSLQEDNVQLAFVAASALRNVAFRCPSTQAVLQESDGVCMLLRIVACYEDSRAWRGPAETACAALQNILHGNEDARCDMVREEGVSLLLRVVAHFSSREPEELDVHRSGALAKQAMGALLNSEGVLATAIVVEVGDTEAKIEAADLMVHALETCVLLVVEFGSAAAEGWMYALEYLLGATLRALSSNPTAFATLVDAGLIDALSVLVAAEPLSPSSPTSRILLDRRRTLHALAREILAAVDAVLKNLNAERNPILDLADAETF